MHHTVAWFENIATGALNDLAPVQDGIVQIQNSHFIFEEPHRLLYCYVGATDIDRARFVTPKFRQITLPFIRPLNPGPTPTDDQKVADYRHLNLIFGGREEFAIEALQDAVGAQDVFAVAGFEWRPRRPVPNGDVYKIRGTSATTATVETWTDLTMTWPDILPWGRYATIGLEHRSANGVAARLIFENQWERPGALSVTDTANIQHPMFSDGELGVYGEFHSTRMPTVQVFCDVANAVHEVYLDLVKIG